MFQKISTRDEVLLTLSAGGRPGDPNVELAARNRERIVDREKVLWCSRRQVAHAISANGTV